jgi:hypothetical protein
LAAELSVARLTVLGHFAQRLLQHYSLSLNSSSTRDSPTPLHDDIEQLQESGLPKQGSNLSQLGASGSRTSPVMN